MLLKGEKIQTAAGDDLDKLLYNLSNKSVLCRTRENKQRYWHMLCKDIHQ